MDPFGTPEWAFELVLMFVAFPIAGVVYVQAVHLLGAWVVRKAPARVARVLGFHLYKSSWDYLRRFDFIAAARRAHDRKAGRAIEGELMPRQ